MLIIYPMEPDLPQERIHGTILLGVIEVDGKPYYITGMVMKDGEIARIGETVGFPPQPLSRKEIWEALCS